MDARRIIVRPGVGLLTLVALLVGCSSPEQKPLPTSPPPTSSGPTSSSPASTTSTSTAPSLKPGVIPGNGRFQVGTEVQPGTYVSDTPAGSMCYAARLGKKEAPDPLITNFIKQGRTKVTIEKTDAYFETRDCADWVKQ